MRRVRWGNDFYSLFIRDREMENALFKVNELQNIELMGFDHGFISFPFPW